MEEYFFAPQQPHEELFDEAQQIAFRRFGHFYIRWFTDNYGGEEMRIIPLRIVLNEFKLSKSQEKIYRRNQKKFTYTVEKTTIDADLINLFDLHKKKFTHNPPPSLAYYIGENNHGEHEQYVKNLTFRVFDDERLVAASFLDCGKKSVSALYAATHPDYDKYSLGIYTILLETEYALRNDFKFYYLGYAHEKASFYDYKKQFFGTEQFILGKNAWKPFGRFESH